MCTVDDQHIVVGHFNINNRSLVGQPSAKKCGCSPSNKRVHVKNQHLFSHHTIRHPLREDTSVGLMIIFIRILIHRYAPAERICVG